MFEKYSMAQRQTWRRFSAFFVKNPKEKKSNAFLLLNRLKHGLNRWTSHWAVLEGPRITTWWLELGTQITLGGGP